MISLNPIGIDAQNQVYAVSIKQKLCKPFCEGASVQPSVDVKFQVDNITNIEGVKYVKIKAQGIITYIPQNSCACNPSSKIFTEYFTVAFSADENVGIDIEGRAGFVEPADVNCYGVACGINWVSAISISLAS